MITVSYKSLKYKKSGDPAFMPDQQRFLTIAEAAEFLHVSQTSLRRWTNSGKLRSFRVGGRNERRFLTNDLLAFVPPARHHPDLLKQPAAETQMIAESETQARHICLFYLSVDEQWQMLRPYMLEYLNANMPVLYIQGSTPHDHLLDLLATEGLPLEDLIARGLLRLLPPEQTYLLGGNLGSQGMSSFLEAVNLGALELGYQRILIIG
jgi:excisionase family DNA binding protein